MTIHRTTILLVVVLLVLLAIAGMMALDLVSVDEIPISDQPTVAYDASEPSTETAAVALRDLVETLAVDGTLGFGTVEPLATNTTGIVTQLPRVGTTIEFGGALFWADNVPIILLRGTLPQWRAFEEGMGNGDDVAQLEATLTEFIENSKLDINDVFNEHTAAVISELQKSLGTAQTGTLPLGSVAFSNEPVRIAQVNVVVGQSIGPQTPALEVTRMMQEVVVDLDPARLDLFATGTPVTIRLPTGDTFDGEVREFAAVATQNIDFRTGEAADPTIDVRISFVDATPEGMLDGSPVEVEVTKAVTAGVLTVPVVALIALRDGGHAVEVWDGFERHLVAVETGEFAEGYVEVEGDLSEGELVVVPSA